MSTPNSPDRSDSELPQGDERRGPNRTRDDADWESKVLARVGGRLRNLPAGDQEQDAGWESSVLDNLRRKIEGKATKK